MVLPVVRSCIQSGQVVSNRTTELTSYDGWHHQSSGGTTSCTTNRAIAYDLESQILNMTIALVATDLPLAITHDLCDPPCVLSTICLRFQIVLVAAMS